MLSGLTKLALEMARGFQAQGLAAGDLDHAGKAESRFSNLFLAIRRAVALQAKLRRQREEAQAAASPAADEAAMLSELMELALALARGFQARGLAALAAGDLDRAGDAETRFSSLFLGIRRAIALKARLRQQREEARREAEHRRKRRHDEKDDRRRAVAQGVAAAIAAAPDIDADAKERLTADLWDRLTEDERIDVDLADTALPIEALIASLCQALGLPPHGPPPAGGAAGAAGTPGTAGAGPKGHASGPAPRHTASNLCHTIRAEDAGGHEGERRILTVAAGEIDGRSRESVQALAEDDRPPGDTGPPDPAWPRGRRRWTDADWAEHRGRKTERNTRWRHLQRLAHIHRHG
ncbi:hypothetical protein KXS07_16045 [Inquilinus limosus]|uniref:hypothetical protein n=1 Tax=Inquilinus limosus TaxID=171674 RepID=UPI003F173F97